MTIINSNNHTLCTDNIEKPNSSKRNVTRPKQEFSGNDVMTLEEYYASPITKFCIFSLRNGKEHKSPWFHNILNAKKALEIIQGKGYQSIMYID